MAMMTAKTVERGEKDYARVIAELTDLADGEVVVGVFEGSMPSEFASQSATRQGPETEIAQYGYYLEVGTQFIPATNWLSGAVDARNGYADLLDYKIGEVQEGKKTAAQALHEVALVVQSDLRVSITEKGLIDTGALRNAVQWEVRTKKETDRSEQHP